LPETLQPYQDFVERTLSDHLAAIVHKMLSPGPTWLVVCGPLREAIVNRLSFLALPPSVRLFGVSRCASRGSTAHRGRPGPQLVGSSGKTGVPVWVFRCPPDGQWQIDFMDSRPRQGIEQARACVRQLSQVLGIEDATGHLPGPLARVEDAVVKALGERAREFNRSRPSRPVFADPVETGFRWTYLQISGELGRAEQAEREYTAGRAEAEASHAASGQATPYRERIRALAARIVRPETKPTASQTLLDMDEAADGSAGSSGEQ